jgi:REP element-mobilizing transposase RayT
VNACARVPVRLLAFCLMPNHFHLALWPSTYDALSSFLHWLLTTHARRNQKQHYSSGHLWQGRFKAFPIQEDDHLISLLRYSELNALRPGLVKRAEDWPWSSLRWLWQQPLLPLLDPGPVPRPMAEAETGGGVNHFPQVWIVLPLAAAMASRGFFCCPGLGHAGARKTKGTLLRKACRISQNNWKNFPCP